ncbi:receptor-like protein 35 [Punica granatum]|uniref:Receptor-like protein 35 n=1 Tax=Punica granatum TaxID=22663 RepID=A0A218X507_PUNGR|nr:receptor-like protein 35 [Punica granatum]OWM80325.1 hypothetical protein CDL15_Pgr019605 [Punica granatum]
MTRSSNPEVTGGSRNSCPWSGVQCDGHTGHVISLDLSNACLSGSINSSSSRFRLVHLESLKLEANNFTLSVIPPEIGNLSRFNILNLVGNVLTGEIPSSFSKFTQLSELYPSNNQLTGQVPSSFQNFTQLSRLSLRQNQLAGQTPSFFGTLTELSQLDLSDNQLTGQIRHSWETSANSLHCTSVSAQLTGQIPSSIGNLMRISSLGLLHAKSRCRHEPPAAGESLLELQQVNRSYSISTWKPHPPGES